MMTLAAASRQIPLDLAYRPALGRADFLVGPCNQDAVAWIDRYPDWPLPVAVLCGPLGSGKSHLLAVWRQMANAVDLDGPTLKVATLDEALGDATAASVDRADAMAEPDCLFHLVNMMRDRGGHLLIAVREPPARWTFGTADMRSRLAAAPLLSLNDPDDDLLGAVLMKLFADRGMLPGNGVLDYLLGRMPRTFDAARDVVAMIDRIGLAERKGATLPIARKALSALFEME